MTKFQKLSQIIKDIELLESYGDFKAADVLHKKFIREAQIKPTSYATEDRGYTYEKYFNNKLKKLQNAQNKDLVISEIRSDGFLKEEDKIQIINAISNSEKSAPVGQLSEQVRQEQKSHQEYLDSIKTPLIPVPENIQQQSPVQTLSDTANQNAFNLFINSPTNANNPDGYRAPSTEGQGVVAGDPVTTTETPLTEEQKRDEYFKNTIKNSQEVENKAVANRMKPQIISSMRIGDIVKAQSILTDYKSSFTQEFIKEIQKTINRMKPETYGIDRSDRNANNLTMNLYRLMRNKSKKAFYGIESKFDSFNIKPYDKQKFIYFKNNLQDIVGEIFNYNYLDNLPQ